MIEILPTVIVSEKAYIGRGVVLGRNIRIWGKTIINNNCVIEDNVQIGHPNPHEFSQAIQKRSLEKELKSLDSLDEYFNAVTSIGEKSIIRSGTNIYSGVEIGAEFDCAHNVTVRENCAIGDNCYIKPETNLLNDITIGENARLAGVICGRTKIGKNVSSFGYILHAYRSGVGGEIEPAPTLEDFVVVGRGASVIGEITLGFGSYIAAGATIASDVPSFSLVLGTKGKIIPDKSPIKGNFHSSE